MDLLADMANVVANGDGTFSYTLPQALPAGFSDATLGTGLMVVMEGRREMPDLLRGASGQRLCVQRCRA